MKTRDTNRSSRILLYWTLVRRFVRVHDIGEYRCELRSFSTRHDVVLIAPDKAEFYLESEYSRSEAMPFVMLGRWLVRAALDTIKE